MRGLTRRLRREWWGCRPEEVVLSFEAKESTKKSTKESTRHGDSRGGPPRCALFANIGVPGPAVPGSCICSGLPVANCLRQLCPLGPRFPSGQFASLTRREKALHCPFCRRGSQRRAQWSWTAIPNACARSCARLFPPSKWAGLFPSAAYRRSAPTQLALGRLSQRELGYYVAAWVVSPHRKTDLIFSHYGWHYAYSISAAWDASPRLGYFCNAKGQREIQITLAFLASHEARRRMAVFTD